MSLEYYVKWWIVSKELEKAMMGVDAEMMKKVKNPVEGRPKVNLFLGELYVKYCLLVQALDICLDQMQQPQKRPTVKKLVDAAAIRLLEINEQLKKVHFSEMVNVDGTLIEQMLIPTYIEMIHSSLLFPRPIEVDDMYKKYKKGEMLFDIVAEQLKKEQEERALQERIRLISEGIDITRKESETSAAAQVKRSEHNIGKEKKVRMRRMSQVFKGGMATKPSETAFMRFEKERKRNAITLIQTMERARSARLYVMEMESAKRARYITFGLKPPPPPDPVILANAATAFQKLWRGHTARQYLKRRDDQRRLLIGMNEPSWKCYKEFEVFKQNIIDRRNVRDQRRKEYHQAILDERNRLLREMAPGLFEDITDEIRAWFHHWYDQIKMFDKYPPEKVGGSILIVRLETFTPKEYLDDYEAKRRAKVKGNKMNDAKLKEKLKKEKELEKQKLKKEAERKKKDALQKKKKFEKLIKNGEYEYEVETETNVYDLFNQGNAEYLKFWEMRNDMDNPKQVHYMDIIHEDKCHEIQLEVRRKVDEVMRIELDLLKDARESDISRMTGKKKKGKKGKKDKKGKGKKGGGKGKKDPFGNNPPEKVFQELLDSGIIRTYPEVELTQFHGDFNYKTENFLEMGLFSPPGLLEVRQAVVMNCVIPLGIGEYKRPKSVLICGPRQSGKHILANSVFNLTQCVLFDLSPEVTAGKYVGKTETKNFLAIVNKMARLLQPSIIFVDGVEKMFYKKVPSEEKEMDPKRLGASLTKAIIKPIKPTDRVMVLGITGRPWLAQAAKLKKNFERTILIPRPDYNSIYMFWRELLMKYHAVDRNFNVSCLSRMTVNYPYTTLKEVLERILTPRRIVHLAIKPLTPEEIFEVFVIDDIKPIDDKEWKKFEKWYSKYPMPKLMNNFKKAIEKRLEKAKGIKKGK